MNCSDKQDSPSDEKFHEDLTNLLESNMSRTVERTTPGGNTYFVIGENGRKGVFVVAKAVPFQDHLNEVEVYRETRYCEDIEMEGVYIGIDHPDEDSRRILRIMARNLIESVDESHGEIDLERWFDGWKNTIGNTVSEKRIYDVIGEMLVLATLLEHGEKPVWLGPDGGNHDISCSDCDYEVKSTVRRGLIPQVTISSAKQLQPAPGKGLCLVLCSLEEDPNGDCSVSSLQRRLVDAGYPSDELESLLNKMDLLTTPNQKKSYRMVDGLRFYSVDDGFPRLTEKSFVGGRFPDHISDVKYTVNLDGIDYERLRPMFSGRDVIVAINKGIKGHVLPGMIIGAV